MARGYLAVKEGCLRCGGTGYIPKYDHVDEGICFRCRNLSADDVKSHAHFLELIADRRKRYGDSP